jgi:hypothetical protein
LYSAPGATLGGRAGNFIPKGNAMQVRRPKRESKMIRVDFTQATGGVKPLHGINNSPVTFGEALPELKDAGIPFVRLHDACGLFGGTYFVDVPNIFPNFEADPDDPSESKGNNTYQGIHERSRKAHVPRPDARSRAPAGAPRALRLLAPLARRVGV